MTDTPATRPPAAGNLFTPSETDAKAEAFEALYCGPAVRVERILSFGHASPEGHWYDQAADEWVMLARGEAVLGFADGSTRTLRAGDWITLPARCRHRVVATSGDAVWLAVHLAAREP